MGVTGALKLVSSLALLATVGLTIAAGVTPAGRYERLALSALVIFAHAVIALGLSAAKKRNRVPRLMVIALLLDVVGAIAWIRIVWTSAYAEVSVTEKVAVLCTGLAVVLMVVGVELSQPANGPAARAVQRATVALTAALVPLWIYGAFGALWDQHWLARVIGSVAVAVVLGLMCNLMMARWHAVVGQGARVGTLAVTCPRCGSGQRIRLGGDRCARCDLRIKVEVP